MVCFLASKMKTMRILQGWKRDILGRGDDNMKEDVSSNSTFIFQFQARMSVKRPKEDLGLSSDLCDKMILIFNTLEVQQKMYLQVFWLPINCLSHSSRKNNNIIIIIS